MSYRVRVRRGDVEVEVESEDKEYVEAKLREFSEEAANIRAPQLSTAIAPGVKPLSLVELSKAVSPQSGSEFTVTVGFYLEQIQGSEEYETKDLISGLKKLGCSFKNYHDVVQKTKKVGWLMEGSSKKALRLTNTGQEWVESRLRNAQSPPAA